MRILLISPPNPEAARLDKAFREHAWCRARRRMARRLLRGDRGPVRCHRDHCARHGCRPGDARGIAATRRIGRRRDDCRDRGRHDTCAARADVAGRLRCVPCPSLFVRGTARAVARAGAATVSSRCASRSGSTWPRAHSRSRRLALSMREFRLVECLLREAGDRSGAMPCCVMHGVMPTSNRDGQCAGRAVAAQAGRTRVFRAHRNGRAIRVQVRRGRVTMRDRAVLVEVRIARRAACPIACVQCE